uniref:Transposase n=1 Tax=Gongylonema pulchrum TaxID=637853 RepID=A0A183DDD9_9BILA
LLYERCGRLLHAERNRRLFGRLKQQKTAETEKISLSRALHDAKHVSFGWKYMSGVHANPLSPA